MKAFRNETDENCPHGGSPATCAFCDEIRRIATADVPDYDPRRRAVLPDDDLLTRDEIVRRWQEAEASTGPGGRLEVVRIRGERRRRNYLKVPGQETAGLILPSAARALRRRGIKVAQQRAVPIRMSRMAQLFAALEAAVSPQRDGLSKPQLRLRPGEWQHDLAWARRRLRGAGARRPSAKPTGGRISGRRSKVEEWRRRRYSVAAELAKRCRECPYCRTPILAGCSLDGTRITRRRRYCDDACKMRYHRRSVIQGPGGSGSSQSIV